MNTVVVPARDTLRSQWEALQADEPRIYRRDAARRLGVSEAELLVAAADPLGIIPLDPQPQRLLPLLTGFDALRTMTRNDSAVLEQTGRYEGLEFFGPAMGQTVGDIELRIFCNRWAMAWYTRDTDARGTRQSIQVFDAHGTSIHKVHVGDAVDLAALVEPLRRHDDPTLLPTVAAPTPAPVVDDALIDVRLLRRRWDAMTDTHQFHRMLIEVGVSRLQAMRLAGTSRARHVQVDALHHVLSASAAAGERIMCFVGNHGIVHVYIGPVRRVVRTPGWLNVLDPEINLHVADQQITTAFAVIKPTEAGPVHSLECYAADGTTVLQLFAKRTPQESTPAWFVDVMRRLP
ncbi:MAG: hypothetical protein MUF00_17840 [Gemmatimonadaceae bacterium]|jgi:putative hemin transport protein|nr:hypothetical protein [Gemmatimonadaceae bacterium]